MGAWVPRTPILSNLQESWSKFSHGAVELAAVFFVPFYSFFCKNSWSIGQTPPPPYVKCFGTSLRPGMLSIIVKVFHRIPISIDNFIKFVVTYNFFFSVEKLKFSHDYPLDCVHSLNFIFLFAIC